MKDAPELAGFRLQRFDNMIVLQVNGSDRWKVDKALEIANTLKNQKLAQKFVNVEHSMNADLETFKFSCVDTLKAEVLFEVISKAISNTNMAQKNIQQQKPFFIEAYNLTKHYGSLVALSGLNLQISEGHIQGLLGCNGAGKSTTMRILAGILKPTRGYAKIMGYDISSEGVDAKKHLGYVPENPRPYESLRVKEFLEFIGKIHGVKGAFLEERIEKFLTVFKLMDRSTSSIGSLSMGMRQKVAISAAMIHQPSVLLLDEPLTGLDPASQRVAKDMLKDFARDGGTVLLSTHILPYAEELCDRIIIIDGGSLIAEGSVSELRQKSRSKAHANLEEVFLRIVGESHVEDTNTSEIQT